MKPTYSLSPIFALVGKLFPAVYDKKPAKQVNIHPMICETPEQRAAWNAAVVAKKQARTSRRLMQRVGAAAKANQAA